jgi:hypothetical protein
MQGYDNTNSGMMARNENRKSDRHPEFSGSINVEGVDYWLSAWVNEGRPGGKMEGKKYFSIKINPKEANVRGNVAGAGRITPESYAAKARPQATGFDEFDDIPF